MLGRKKKKYETQGEKERAIWDACEQGRLEILQKVFKDDSSFANITDAESKTPIHIAALNGQTEIVQYLLKNFRIQYNNQDKRGWNALHCAAMSRNENTILLLLAQPDIKGTPSHRLMSISSIIRVNAS